jgi:tetratricopeptide (TPR) repeat protein
LVEALKNLTESQRFAEQAVRENPVSHVILGNLANVDRDLADYYLGWAEDNNTAAEWFRKALAAQHTITAVDAADPAGALALGEEALAVMQPLLRADPNSRRTRRMQSMSLSAIAEGLGGLGRKEKALTAIHKAFAMQVEDLSKSTDNSERRELLGFFHTQGELEQRFGNREAAVASFREGLRLFEGVGLPTPSLDAYEDQGDFYRAAAQCFGSLAKDPRTPPEARAGLAKESLALWRKSAEIWAHWPNVGSNNFFVEKRLKEASRAASE